MLIKPTVGRKLWFKAGIEDTKLRSLGDQPFSAEVVYVHNDREVNLVVFDHVGTPREFRRVRLVQEDDEIPGEGERACVWMPYQLGQAAKTEAVEAAATQAPTKAPAPQPAAQEGSSTAGQQGPATQETAGEQKTQEAA